MNLLTISCLFQGFKIPGHKHSDHPLALTSGFACRTSGNIEICNVFILF